MSGWLGEIENGKSPAISGRTDIDNRQGIIARSAGDGSSMRPSDLRSAIRAVAICPVAKDHTWSENFDSVVSICVDNRVLISAR